VIARKRAVSGTSAAYFMDHSAFVALLTRILPHHPMQALYGDELDIVTSPVDGLFVRSTTLLTMAKGNGLRRSYWLERA
jgi:hypothetical protein